MNNQTITIISGATSGIGYQISQTLLQKNHLIYGMGRTHPAELVDNPFYHPITVDLSQEKKREHVFKELKNELNKNNQTADNLIMCAGMGHFDELEQWSDKKINEVMQVNCIATFCLLKHFIPAMKKRKQGRVIIIGSESALSGAKKGSIYCASKFALRGFAQSLREECKHANIGVSLINPGFVDTPFFDHLSFKPDENKMSSIQPSSLSSCVEFILNMPIEAVIEEINLQPLVKRIKK